MKKLLRFSLALSLVLCLSFTFALGQGKISGKVTSTTGEPMSFSVVYIAKTNYGATVDVNGNFTVSKVPAGTYKLTASYVGYKKSVKEVTVTDNQTTNIDFVLVEDTTTNEVIITGIINPKTALESSISISSVKASQLQETAPRSTAEILRSVPGIRSEASAGEGNTNITVRGVPIATGGSKFLQLHEDGLPVLQFGDIAFATADIFMRADNTVARVEALRGGSASTLASNSPAGIINFISKNGNVAGGSVATTLGLDYRNFRTDFEYGAPIANGWNFHLGGFYRQGDGPRTTNFTSSNGGQFKANLTKNFEKGYARVYFKFLNDRTPAYMPMPMTVSGTNADPTWGSVAGYDALRGALQSPFLLNNIGTGADGNIRRSNIADGINPVSTAIGSELAFDLGDGWNLLNRNRFAMNSGSFTAPFPAQVGDATAVANQIAGAGARITYANGAAFPANANGNNLLMRMHLFDTKLNNMNNFTNDLNVNKSFGQVTVNAGIYKAYQAIGMSWLWNSYLTDVSDKGSRLVNVTNAAGDTAYTDNGVLAYGTPFWGNLHRNYDTHYDITAPYAGFEYKPTEKLTVDVSTRYDMGRVYGSFNGANTKPLDVNGDGTISFVEQKVNVMDNTKSNPVNYRYEYLSYSLGANYILNDKMAVFARHSTGARANADRLLFGPYILADGSAAAGLKSDVVTQTEVGYKMRKNNYTINATGFLASVEEQNFEATTQNSVNRTYTAYGLELDGTATFGNFNIRGGLTYTKAEISKDEINKTQVGNTPRRQAPYIFQIMPSYTYKKHSIGISAIGTGKSYAQDDNKLVMPGYTYFNAFINFGLTEKMSLSINANNLFNTIGVTESEEGSITENTSNIVRARSIAGRTISAALRISF
ncbi:MAG: TonB-dependent receptor [Flexibacteraceae bacterium]